LAFVPPQHPDKVRADLSLLWEAFDAGVVSLYARAQDSAWTIWSDFCEANGMDPALTDVADPILLLQIVARQRYQDGCIAPLQKPVRSRTVEDAL
jgi:hypothetical protein